MAHVKTDSYRNRYWSCACDCGNVKVVDVRNLKSGATKSCRQCRLSVDYTGRVFGRLTATNKFGRLHDYTRALECVCTCGVRKLVALYRLLNGETKSCGCLKREKETKQEGTALRNQLCRYKVSARYRKLPWELQDTDAIEILLGKCAYCGLVPANGIDRVDNSRGYTAVNATPCCKICNRAKNTASLEEFAVWMRRVAAKFTAQNS